MRLVKASAENIAERWKQQYFRSDKWITTARGSSEAIYEALCALGPRPKIAAAVKILGNKSWTHVACTGCNGYVKTAVMVSTDDNDCHLCRNCILEASKLISPRAAL